MNSTVNTERLLSLPGIRTLTACALLFFLVANATSQTRGRKLQNPTSGDPVSRILWLEIVRAEDERRWDDDLRNLFKARNANVRRRAVLAAGRIGNGQAVADLIPLLQKDDEPEVRAMAAFALGEIESPLGADALVTVLSETHDSPQRSRALEALGKITAALPKEQETRARQLAAVVLETLNFEASRRSDPDSLTILLGLTAVLRAKPEGAGPIVAKFLRYSNPRIRGDAANTLARLKLKDGNDELRKLLVSDPDAVVRANAARVLGATEEKRAYDDLLDRALEDRDARVRVSAIRALATLKDAQATSALLERGATLLATANSARKKSAPAGPSAEVNELLEIAGTLGRLRQDANDERVVTWLRNLRPVTGSGAPEVEIAFARAHPAAYLNQFGAGPLTKRMVQETLLLNWRAASSIAQGLGEIATIQSKAQKAQAEDLLRAMLDYRNSGININTLVAVHSEYAIPDVLQAYAAFKTNDLAEVARKHLKESDVVIRAAAAGLLGDLPPDEINARALIAALPVALVEARLDDSAALAILDALGKQKSAKANEAIKTALDSNEHLIRRKAVAVLKANGAGDFSSRIGIVRTRYTSADYERAFARIGKRFSAVVTTTRGWFMIELLTEEAPLTVDNFIQLARRRYFNAIIIHRVVPNFVIQDGDPRGDGNGGPGYQIRCEINEVPYKRGAVGMALSGKDTGGSQWFVTHSPQPHLDGGYTVFGNIVAGSDVVDNIVRGDVIRSIAITGTTPRSRRH